MKFSALAIPLTAVVLLAGQTAFSQDDTKVIIVNGEVVQYDPGKVLVIRAQDNTEKRYTLTPTVVMPKDLQVGQVASVYVEPSAEGGSTVVKRITTTSTTPSGQTKQTVEETRTEPSGAKTTTTTTTTSGKVEAYTAGKSVTVVKADGSRVTYIINPKSTVPDDLDVGSTISIVPANPGERVVQTITVRNR